MGADCSLRTEGRQDRRTDGRTDRRNQPDSDWSQFSYSPKNPRLFPAELQYFIVEKYGIYLTHCTSVIRSLYEDYFPISVNATFCSGLYKFAY
jgi:hypothetical protein